jgi:pimeloyl-ACP methyl ester carboxylesterase
MPRQPMPDVVVLLPGITGSVLKKDGQVAWGFSGRVLASALLTRGASLRRALLLAEDPADQDELGDGVVADALIDDLHLLPGLWKIDGYSKVADTIQARFDVTEGENFFRFPYDWRRDNRVAARRLARESHGWLKHWRERGNADAKLILVAHSMGGLVSRYFLEVLEGWKDTRALVSFGTPYRGSLNALDMLANGMKKGPGGFLDLSALGRSFTSVYQLLPIYPCLDADGGPMARVGEAVGVPNVDAARARDALAFHREIEDAVAQNRENDAYTQRGYRVYPVVGIAQDTLQSGRVRGEGVELLKSHDGTDHGGDGTVPRVSATPIEYSAEGRDMFAATRHASLQNADAVLTQLDGLINSLYFDLGGFRKPSLSPVKVAIEVEDLFWRGEPIRVRARPEREDVQLIATLMHTDRGEAVGTMRLHDDVDGWQVAEFAPPGEGSYRVEVSGGADVEPAADAFAVAGAGPDDERDGA